MPQSESSRPTENRARRQRDDALASSLARHILPSSGTMIGICTTLIGLVKLLEGRTGPSRVDEYGALVAFLFLGSAMLSYLSIRMEHRPSPSRACERVADLLFIIGLTSIVGIAALFAFERI